MITRSIFIELDGKGSGAGDVALQNIKKWGSE